MKTISFYHSEKRWQRILWIIVALLFVPSDEEEYRL